MCAGAKAYKDLTTEAGLPSGHIYGAMTKLLSWIKRLGPSPIHLVWAFDSGRAYKEAIYSEYKAKRTTADPSLSPIPDIRRMLEYLPSTSVWLEGHEADDVMATVASDADTHQEVFVFSTDRDLWQLMDDGIQIIGFTGNEIMDADLLKQFGVNGEDAHLIALHKAIWGDSGDGVPRVTRLNAPDKGDGPELIRIMRATDGTPRDFMLKVRRSKKLDPKTQAKIEEHSDQIQTNWNLTNLYRDLHITSQTNPGEPKQLENLLKEFECRSLIPKMEIFSL